MILILCDESLFSVLVFEEEHLPIDFPSHLHICMLNFSKIFFSGQNLGLVRLLQYNFFALGCRGILQSLLGSSCCIALQILSKITACSNVIVCSLNLFSFMLRDRFYSSENTISRSFNCFIFSVFLSPAGKDLQKSWGDFPNVSSASSIPSLGLIFLQWRRVLLGH